MSVCGRDCGSSVTVDTHCSTGGLWWLQPGGHVALWGEKFRRMVVELLDHLVNSSAKV